jgi:hypothetical protein
MAKINNNAALTVREIEYSIRIRDKDSSFNELRDVLKSELTKFVNGRPHHRLDADNPIQEFLRNNIDRSIIIRENTRIYFLNYREKEGSLKIEFTLLVITTYINYAQIRQALDSLVKDTIAEYFEELLERHMPVNISVQSNDKEIVTVDESLSTQKSTVRSKRDIFTRVLAIIALAISLVIASISAYNAFYGNSQAENAKLKEDYMNLLLEKKIIEAVKDQKFTINLYKIADTAGTAQSTKPVPQGK